MLGELRPPKDPDRRDVEMLLAKLDDAEQPERARLVRVSAEPPSPAGPCERAIMSENCKACVCMAEAGFTIQEVLSWLVRPCTVNGE